MHQDPITPESSDPRRWGVLAAMGLGVFMATLDMSVVTVALPSLVQDLHTDLATIQWVLISYSLVITSLIIGAGRFGDMHGKKRLYLGGLGIFTLGSLLSGLAPNVGWLIAFRSLQGLGAVVTQALGTAIVTEVFPAGERGRALGVIGAVVAVGLASGPPLGGLLIGAVGWRAVFLVNVPVGIFTGAMVLRLVPRLPAAATGQRFDLAGAVVLMSALGSLALGLTLVQTRGFGDPVVTGLLALGAVGLVVFVLVEKKVRHPMLELALFKNLSFSLNLTLGLSVFVVQASSLVIPFFLQLVQGFSTARMGLLMMVVPVVMGLSSPISGALSDRLGTRWLSLIGLVIMSLGCLAYAGLRQDTSVAEFILRSVPYGLGMGIFLSPNNSAIMGAASRRQLGVASGLLALSRTLGVTSGVPIIGAIYTAHVLAAWPGGSGGEVAAAPTTALVAGVAGAYSVAAVGIALAAGLCAVGWFFERRRRAAPG